MVKGKANKEDVLWLIQVGIDMLKMEIDQLESQLEALWRSETGYHKGAVHAIRRDIDSLNYAISIIEERRDLMKKPVRETEDEAKNQIKLL